MFSIQVKNLDRLKKNFEKFPKTTAPILERATKDAGKEVYRTEVKEAPHATGNLQRTIQSVYRPIQITIEPKANYAGYVHGGTGIYGAKGTPITPKTKKMLAWKSGGKWHFAKSVRGQRANPFVERTVRLAKGKVNEIFNKALKLVIESLTK